MTQEVTILTAARTEMDDIFQGDAKAKLAYMIRYRKKHRGLAFPVPIDLPLVIKGFKSSDTSSLCGEIASFKTQMTKMETQMASLKTSDDNLRNAIAELRRGNNNTNGGGGGGSSYETSRSNPPLELELKPSSVR